MVVVLMLQATLLTIYVRVPTCMLGLCREKGLTLEVWIVMKKLKVYLVHCSV